MNQQGFTLIEVLVALALMALLSIMSWRALDLVERSRARLNASADDTLALLRVMGQIESDIRRHANADILPVTAASPMHAPGRPAASAGGGLPAGIFWTDPVLTIVRSAYGGAWQQVAWGQDGDTLRRAAGPAAQALPLPAPVPGVAMLGQVRRFMVRAWVPGHGWSSAAPSGQQGAATGLEIVVERMHDGASVAYRKVVLLP